MKQIGARQEAGRIGGIGPCGRPLCCASWMTNFVSVGTAAARFQDISLNPQKLAGQCAKLKCCLNFEVDAYVEARKKMPSKEMELETKDNVYYFFKSDIFARKITYSTDKAIPANLVTIDAGRAFEIIALNRRGIKPDKLERDDQQRESQRKEYQDVVGQDSLTRFDNKKRKKKGGGGGANNPQANNNRNERRRGNNPNHAPANNANATNNPNNNSQRKRRFTPSNNHNHNEGRQNNENKPKAEE